MECPGNGNYKGPRIFGVISQLSNVKCRESVNTGIARGLEVLEVGNIGGFTVGNS